MKNVVKCGAVLFVISVVVAFILASVNSVTKDKIAQNDIDKTNRALSEVMAADKFEKLGDIEKYVLDETYIKEIYRAEDSNGTVGYCFNASGKGYGGKDSVNLIIGVDKNCTITGVSVVSQNETAGLGANVTREDFRAQFKGEGEVTAVKAPAFENEADGKITALTGATVTSKCVAECTNQAVAAAKLLYGEDALTTASEAAANEAKPQAEGGDSVE